MLITRHQHPHPRTTSPKRAYHESIHSMPPAKKCTCPRVCARLCNHAETSLPWKLLRTYLESCVSIAQAVVRRPPCCWPDEICRPRMSAQISSKSTLAHDSIAAAVSHTHYSIIRVGADLIQFVYGRTCSSAAKVIPSRNLFPPFFSASF